MADWGVIGAGLVKGVADYSVETIRNQQEEDRKMRQAKMLEELRVSTEEKLAKFRDKMERARVDKDFSGAEGDEMVYRNKDGQETSRRALTPTEIEARDFQRNERDLKIRSGEQDIKASEAGIRQGDERLALTRRGQDMDAAQSRERNSIARAAASSKDSDSGGMGDVSATSIGYQLTDLNNSAVEQAMKSGVPREEIQRMAQLVAAGSLARGDKNVESMNNKFLRGLAELRKGIEGTGQDATWSLSTFNKTRADEVKRK